MSETATQEARSDTYVTPQSLCTRGIRDCDRGLYPAAVKNLERAATMIGHLRDLPPRALGSYGLSLAATNPESRDQAIGYCKQAIRRSPADPMLYRLLAKAYLLQGSRGYAVHTLDAGLKADPRHAGLRRSRSEVGFRATPLFPSLGRNHPVNRLFGKLRYRLKRLLRLT